MTVQDIVIVHTIWGNNIVALKWNTTSKKPIYVAGKNLKTPKEIINIYKKVFMTANIFFVNGIPFSILLSQNINFTTVRDLEDRKYIKIFKAFKEIYMHDMKRGFQITTLHMDGEFVPL